MKLMIFDVGGTEIKYSVMGEDLIPAYAGSVPTPMTTLDDFLNLLNDLYQPHKAEVHGIAMSLPGFIDTEKGVVNGGGALEYNWGQPVGPLLAEKCGCSVHIINDGKAAALAELREGALSGCKNASVFLIGTGVGGGLIVDGKIVNGSHFTAGEYSFVNVNSHDWFSPDETMASRCSTPGLLKRYREQASLPPEFPMDGRRFFSLVHEGDEAANHALEVFCLDVAVQLYNLAVLLDLERVAIGGGISKQPVLIQCIQKKLDEVYERGPATMSGGSIPKPEVVPCFFSSEANQVGAFCNAQCTVHNNISYL